MSPSDRDDKVYTCPLCGHRFRHGDEKCHSCPLSSEKGCNVVCCPNCGYSFSEDSRVVEWFRRKFGGKKERAIPDEERKVR